MNQSDLKTPVQLYDKDSVDKCSYIQEGFPILNPKPKVCGRPREDDIHDPLSMKLGAHEFIPPSKG